MESDLGRTHWQFATNRLTLFGPLTGSRPNGELVMNSRIWFADHPVIGMLVVMGRLAMADGLIAEQDNASEAGVSLCDTYGCGLPCYGTQLSPCHVGRDMDQDLAAA